MISYITVKGPRHVVEIKKPDGSIVGADFSYKQQMIDWICGQRGEVEISEVKAGQSMTYIKAGKMRKVGT